MAVIPNVLHLSLSGALSPAMMRQHCGAWGRVISGERGDFRNYGYRIVKKDVISEISIKIQFSKNILNWNISKKAVLELLKEAHIK